ncbi:MAG: DUF5615 family PIN-like protein [Hyphomicrobiales bacterium]|nr:DUF5615 family PIN-like protein [Hyphomicrobiales bacterium]
MQRLSGNTDVALYEACRAESRVLVTLDRDFGEVLRFPPEESAGIAILVWGEAADEGLRIAAFVSRRSTTPAPHATG